MTKPCAKCHVVKPLEDFHKQPRGPKGRHSYCKACYARMPRKRLSETPANRRKWSLKRRYGLTQEAWAAMLSAQGGVCAICGAAPKRPCVDHNHGTKRTRAILCHRCNIGLPYIEDSAWAAKAVAYLKAHA